jgi:hypothetical protein
MNTQAARTPAAHAPELQSNLQLDLPTGHLQVQVEQSRLPFDDLLGFAARDNAKRGFLFLSKVLGKHWPVTPANMQQIHLDLASRIPVDLPGPVLFIALAETAIGLGQGVFEAWLGHQPLERQPLERQPQSQPQQAPALFLHSSRYRVDTGELIEFEEAHSHAPRQFLHMPQDPALAALLAGARSLVLVDDEASTGNTFVNLCHALRGVCPMLAQVHLALITDFMGPATRAALGQRFGLPTSIGATLSGQYQFTPCALPPTAATAPAAQRFDAQAANGASACFGRLGLAQALPTRALDALAQELCQQIGAHESVLVLGTGEFMHPAFLLARALEQRGCEVKVQATTRSPILSWGAAVTRLQFMDNYGENIANYLYNVSAGQYHHVLICHETAPNAALLDLAVCLQGRLFHFQSEAQIEEIPVR